MNHIDLDALILKAGSHKNPENGLCFMEAVAYFAGQPHTDHPPCVSPVIGAFLRRWNDDLDDAGRQRLKPYIPKVVGTAGDKAADEQWAWLVTDWLVRVHTPAWLRLAGLEDHAVALEGLAPILSRTSARAGQPTINEAKRAAAAAGDAAWDAAWDAARAAAGDAARAAAWAAARDAARAAAGAAAWAAARDAARAAAGAAARAAAWDAARAAAWDAARDAARDVLEPTRMSLQESAFELLDRMIEAS